jgi:ppGpp synthetase/RelA/SpoT-type nucleotidyltranferase
MERCFAKSQNNEKMKLFTKADQVKLQSQWGFGSDLKSQMVFVKIFEPMRRVFYYVVNQDPNDPERIFAIEKTNKDIKLGFFRKSAIENAKLPPFGIRFERDMYFDPIPAQELLEGLLDGQYYAKGGELVVDVNEKIYDKGDYRAIFGDFDKDGLVNVDDPNPYKTGDTRTIEQVKFSEVLQNVIQNQKKVRKPMYDIVEKLKQIAPKGSKIIARTKSPYSILNKLVNKKMDNLDKTNQGDVEGLTDLVGTTILVDNFRSLEALKKKILNGAIGEIFEFKDYYENPKAGYMAYHFITLFEDVAVEVQIKTKRMKLLNQASHFAYKDRALDSNKLLYLSQLMDKADRGDTEAKAEAKDVLSDRYQLAYDLYLDKSKYEEEKIKFED